MNLAKGIVSCNPFGNKNCERGRVNIVVIVATLFVMLTALLPLMFIALRVTRAQQINAKTVAVRFAEYIDSLPAYSAELLDDGDNNDLADTIAPDHAKVINLGNKSFNAMWNVADGVPAKGMKTIQIIVAPVGGSKKYTLTVTRSAAGQY